MVDFRRQSSLQDFPITKSSSLIILHHLCLSVKCVHHVMLLKRFHSVLSVSAAGLQFQVDQTADERDVLCIFIGLIETLSH